MGTHASQVIARCSNLNVSLGADGYISVLDIYIVLVIDPWMALENVDLALGAT